MTSHDDLEPDGVAPSDEDRRLVAHWAAARAACYAAATPYTHALATPHQSKHVLGPAVYQAQARELAAGYDPSAGDEEMLFYQLDVGLSR